jgi:phenylalanyl-tRNA synthetase beta chain
MKLAYEHLITGFKKKPSMKDLSCKLFQLGHEHTISGNIIDFELTPNRGDCLSLNGIRRDLHMFYGFTNYEEIYDKPINNFNLKFLNNAKDECPKISFLKIEIDKVPKHYNNQLHSYFLDLELKKNNFFTDVSNYISYETGQPTHCYELSKISNEIYLNLSNKKENFETLLDKTIEVDKQSLVFTNKNNELINLAGIIGGKNTACDVNTKSVILECAYFNPEIILGKAVKYAIKSEAAHKFERNVDIDSHEYVIRRFINIVKQHTNITNLELMSETYLSSKKIPVPLNIDKINNILGVNITEQQAISFLENFGFVVDKKLIYAPSYRHDIYSINDIAEEIARAIGYDNISPIKINLTSKIEKKYNNQGEVNLKKLLINNGFSEVINDPFVKNKEKFSIKVDNPLDSGRKFLRTNLRDSLLDNLYFNERRQKDSIKLFEIADIYSSEQNCKRYIGIIATGRLDYNYRDFSKKISGKYLLNLMKNINKNFEIKSQILPRDFLKSKSKSLINYVEIELSPSFQFHYKSDTNIDPELNFQYVPISDFPSSSRDLSLSFNDLSECETILEYIFSFKDELIKNVFIFDYFKNEKNKEIKIGFRFIFQSSVSTITDNEVNHIMDVIISKVSETNGVSIPGLS